MRILILASSLSQGGITQSAVNMANRLVHYGDVTIAYSAVYSQHAKDSLDPAIHCVTYIAPSKKQVVVQMLKKGWAIHALKVKFRNHNKVTPMKNSQRVQYAKAEITELPEALKQHFDVVISTEEFYCNNVAALKLRGSRKIAWVHPDYKSLNTDVKFDRKILDQFDYLCVVSDSNRKSMIDRMPDASSRIVYVPNLLNFSFIRENSEQIPEEYTNSEGIRIATVCRLDNSSKRLDRIVDICSKLKAKEIKFHWYLIGDGPDREMISSLISNRKIQDCISLLGGKENPYPYMRHADVFVMTSQYEGRPIAVDEAMFLKCPVIVTQYASAREQVPDGCGAIVENADSTCVNQIAELITRERISQWRENLNQTETEQQVLKLFDSKIEEILS